MERVIVYTDPDNPMSEAYRTLCTNVLAKKGENKLFEIVAVAENNNADLVVANLATAMAQAGKTVLVMDCNLRNPKMHEIFALQNKGITDCITDMVSFNSYVQLTEQTNLYVLTAGAAVKKTVEILLSMNMNNILSETKELYDIVLITVPPVCEVFDAVSLGTKTDGVLLVLTNKQDKMKSAQKAKDLFTQAGVDIIGCILNKVNIS